MGPSMDDCAEGSTGSKIISRERPSMPVSHLQYVGRFGFCLHPHWLAVPSAVSNQPRFVPSCAACLGSAVYVEIEA